MMMEDTDPCSYMEYYSFLPNHQHLLQDHVRMKAYHDAILKNSEADFKDRVVLDCGSGCGVLALIAAKAGAKEVFAVEASEASSYAEDLCRCNDPHGRVRVVRGFVEDVQDIEKTVDVVLCEGMGTMLVHERMLESYLDARDRFLKPGGMLYPSRARMHFAPFQDLDLRRRTVEQASFWSEEDYYGLDLRLLHGAAIESYLSQPVVGPVDPCTLLGPSNMYEINFYEATKGELVHIQVDIDTSVLRDGQVDGLVGWFDVAFDGGMHQEWLTTAPGMPITHWQQVRLLLKTPLPVKSGERVRGQVEFHANPSRSYAIEVNLQTMREERSSFPIQLNNPIYRYENDAPG